MTCVATAQLDIPRPEALLDRIAADLDALEVPFADRRPQALDTDTGIGMIAFAAVVSGLSVRIDSDCDSNLHMLRETVLARMEALQDDLSARLVWSRLPLAGSPPPNFRLARVLGRRRVGAGFLRLRLGADRLEDFARSGLHLRLLLPPGGRAPEWPRMDARGRTRWPEGDAALHTPAYTIRAIDPAAGWMDVDVFLHGNGPTCAWVESVAEGALLGLSGPGGGWFPTAQHLVLAGDETALPAIARILEQADPATTGTALVEIADPRDAVAIDHPRGMALRWLLRGRDAALEEVLAGVDMGTPGGRHLWFAAEKQRAAKVRTLARETLGIERRESYIAAYWTRVGHS